VISRRRFSTSGVGWGVHGGCRQTGARVVGVDLASGQAAAVNWSVRERRRRSGGPVLPAQETFVPSTAWECSITRRAPAKRSDRFPGHLRRGGRVAIWVYPRSLRWRTLMGLYRVVRPDAEGAALAMGPNRRSLREDSKSANRHPPAAVSSTCQPPPSRWRVPRRSTGIRLDSSGRIPSQVAGGSGIRPGTSGSAVSRFDSGHEAVRSGGKYSQARSSQESPGRTAPIWPNSSLRKATRCTALSGARRASTATESTT
jgi:hypothetical protein